MAFKLFNKLFGKNASVYEQKILPQVNPEFMGGIVTNTVKKLSFYNPADRLMLTKPQDEILTIEYCPIIKPEVKFKSVIYAQEPRKYFGGCDITSFMLVSLFESDDDEELFDAVRSIKEESGIEKVLAGGHGVSLDDAEVLNQIGKYRSEQDHIDYLSHLPIKHF